MLERLQAEDQVSHAEFVKWALTSPRPPVCPMLGVAFSWEDRVADFDPPANAAELLHYVGQLEAKRMLMRTVSAGNMPTLAPRELFALIDFLRGTPPPAKKADLALLSVDEIVTLEALLKKARK